MKSLRNASNRTSEVVKGTWRNPQKLALWGPGPPVRVMGPGTPCGDHGPTRHPHWEREPGGRSSSQGTGLSPHRGLGLCCLLHRIHCLQKPGSEATRLRHVCIGAGSAFAAHTPRSASSPPRLSQAGLPLHPHTVTGSPARQWKNPTAPHPSSTQPPPAPREPTAHTPTVAHSSRHRPSAPQSQVHARPPREPQDPPGAVAASSAHAAALHLTQRRHLTSSRSRRA